MLYTSGTWFVKADREEEFVEAWSELARWTAAEIAPGAHAMLLRDRDEQSRFVSFGPWENEEQIVAWRESEGFAARVEAIRELLDEFEAHTLDLAAQVGDWPASEGE